MLTPNLPEAATLVGHLTPGGPAGDRSDEAESDARLARELGRLGPRHVVLTGGHRDAMTDLYWDGVDLVEIDGEIHEGRATHGSGCTHSAILAAQLGLGRSVLDAARVARTLSARRSPGD